MEKIKVHDIAIELGVNSTTVINQATLLSIRAKTSRSSVSIDDAQKIFDAIMYSPKKLNCDEEKTFFYSGNNLNIYLTSHKIDYNYLSKMALPYKNDKLEDFLIFSYNFSNKTMLELYSMSLNELNINSYLKNTLHEKEYEELHRKIEKFSDKIDISYINDQNPFNDIEKYIKEYKPQMIYIEGIDTKVALKKIAIFHAIKKAIFWGVNFELSFINADKKDTELLKSILVDLLDYKR